jgi:hypothetical protein
VSTLIANNHGEKVGPIMTKHLEADITTTEGRRLAILRKIRAGATAIRFAEMAGFTSSRMSSILSGKAKMSELTGKKIELALGLVPGILQGAEESTLSEQVSVESLFLDQTNKVLEELRAEKARRPQTNAIRIEALKAIMGRLSLDDFCHLYSFKKPLLRNVLCGTRPFNETLARKIEKRLKLHPGSMVFPDDSFDGKRKFMQKLDAINATSVHVHITPMGEKLLEKVSISLKRGELSDGQVLALTALIDQFSQQTRVVNHHLHT